MGDPLRSFHFEKLTELKKSPPEINRRGFFYFSGTSKNRVEPVYGGFNETK